MSFFPYQPTVLFHRAVPSSVTGTLVTTTLGSFVVKGTVMGPRDTIMFEAIYSFTNSANVKVLSVTVGGTSVYGVNVTTTATNGRIIYFMNRESLSSQSLTLTTTTGSYGNIGTASTAINMGIQQSVLFRGTLNDTGETITLERASATILRVP